MQHASKHQELRQAVIDLRQRALYQSALWAAEMLAGDLLERKRHHAAQLLLYNGDLLLQLGSWLKLLNTAATGLPPGASKQERHCAVSPETEDGDAYLLAKGYFDTKVSH